MAILGGRYTDGSGEGWYDDEVKAVEAALFAWCSPAHYSHSRSPRSAPSSGCAGRTVARKKISGANANDKIPLGEAETEISEGQGKIRTDESGSTQQSLKLMKKTRETAPWWKRKQQLRREEKENTRASA